MEKERDCVCGVSVLGKVLRADCPVCMGTGKRKVYFCVDCEVKLPPGLDGNRCSECIVPSTGRSTLNLVPWLKECTEREGWTLDREMMVFCHGEERMTFRQAVEKYREERIKAVNAPMTEEESDELLEAATSKKKITDGIMNHIEYSQQPPELTEKEFNEFMEVAFQPKGLAEWWKRGGWEQEGEKDEFVKGELRISFSSAVEIFRMCQDLEPMLHIGSGRPVIGPNDKIVPGMVVPTELMDLKHFQRAIVLLRAWHVFAIVDGINAGEGLPGETEAFLKEVDDVEQKVDDVEQKDEG